VVASARLARFLPRSARLSRRFVNGKTLNCSQGAKRGSEGDPASPRASWLLTKSSSPGFERRYRGSLMELAVAFRNCKPPSFVPN
jgi:hypothetical protein